MQTGSPCRWTSPADSFRVGGAWRYEQQTPRGDVAFKVVYQEFVPPGRIVHTEIFDAEGFVDQVSFVTIVLTEENGRTTGVSRQRFPTVETRDMVLSTGMEHGAAESRDRMAELLATRTSRPARPGGGRDYLLRCVRSVVSCPCC